MFKSGKNFIASMLVLFLFAMPCSAVQNYTYTTRIQDNYTVEQPQGSIVNNNYYENYNTPTVGYAPYYTNGYVNGYVNGYTPVYQNGYYNGYAQNSTAYPPVVANSSQPYNRDYTVTQSYEDTREKVDKNISRAGGIALIVGGLALAGAVVTSALKK